MFIFQKGIVKTISFYYGVGRGKQSFLQFNNLNIIKNMK